MQAAKRVRCVRGPEGPVRGAAMASIHAENVANLTTASADSLTTASIVSVKIQSCVTKFEGRKK